MSDTIILDIDGTLVDSNYQHALAWYRALRRYHAGKLGVPTFAVRTGEGPLRPRIRARR